MWSGPAKPGSVNRSLLQRHLGDVTCSITLNFAYGDGWSSQCRCPQRCERKWLNSGWICPHEYHRTLHLDRLDKIYESSKLDSDLLRYVNWNDAVLELHSKVTFTEPSLHRVMRFALDSAGRVLSERDSLVSAEIGGRGSHVVETMCTPARENFS